MLRSACWDLIINKIIWTTATSTRSKENKEMIVFVCVCALECDLHWLSLRLESAEEACGEYSTWERSSGPASATPTPTKPAHLSISLMEPEWGQCHRETMRQKKKTQHKRETFLFVAGCSDSGAVYSCPSTHISKSVQPCPKKTPIHRIELRRFVKKQSAAVADWWRRKLIHGTNQSTR